ncbi:hypothetical protein PCANB_002585 [Pneumocystis canis]|nr:hypothetical protein PCK1_002629 [Pneumocystis canis]KAG5438481.1 hypothetical protein PCANB_002585 [Pneumocystis canis]
MGLISSQEVLETTQELISRIEKEAKKYENKKSKPVSRHTFTLSNGMKIDSWRLPDFGPKKLSKTIMNIRGLFSITNDKNIHKIVIREGYDKFFSVNEVKITQWEMLEKLTKGPYEVTLKENGCIIFISALPDLSLVVASKHSIGPTSNCTYSHAQMGEIWLDRHLSSVKRTREQLASILQQKNATLVSELCDDSFEEHVIEYPPEKRGLYLHGINQNTPSFSTAQFSEVCFFASEWGFNQVDFMIFETLSEVKGFLENTEKIGFYHGKEVEGFVVRCKSKYSDEDMHFHDFFFKYKFKEPYLMYRRWREVTHSVISDTYTLNNRDSDITKEYVKWVRLLLKNEPDHVEKYKQNHGIIALRKRFLKEYNYSHSDLAKMLTIMADHNPGSRSILLITIGTVGCGKTALSLALSSLFGFGHIQNDDIVGKKAKIRNFVLKIADALKHQHVVVADKNNHKFIERKELIHLVSELSPDTRFIALYYHHFDKDSTPAIQKQELSKILKVTQARVFARGSNHQTIDASANKARTVLGIMNGFLSRFEPLDVTKKPDSMFEEVIILDPMKDLRYNLEIVIDKLEKIIPNYMERPTSSEIDAAIHSALNDYHPIIKRPILSQSCQTPEYFAIVLDDDLSFYVEDIMLTQSLEKRAFWEHLKKSNRVQKTFHVTLIHMAEKLIYPQIWESFLYRSRKSSVISHAEVEFTHIVWDSRIMALVAVILDAKEKKIESVNLIPHTTIGTENKTIPAKESNDLLLSWKCQESSNDIMALTLCPKRFSGVAVAVYPTHSAK